MQGIRGCAYLLGVGGSGLLTDRYLSELLIDRVIQIFQCFLFSGNINNIYS